MSTWSNAGWLLVDMAIKATLVLAAAMLWRCVSGRRQSAARRHTLGLAAVTAAMVLPALATLPSSWRIAWWPAPQPRQALTASGIGRIESGGLTETARSESSQAPASPAAQADSRASFASGEADTSAARLNVAPVTESPWRWPSAVIAIWVCGALLVIGRWLIGWRRAARLLRHSDELRGDDWQALLDEQVRRTGFRGRVALRRSREAVMPMAVGLWRAAIALPAGCDGWPAERRRAVLAHELAHVKRRDALSQFVVAAATAVHWFNPLVWLTARQLRLDREQACDDAVLAGGTRPSDYADALLWVARSLRVRCGSAAVAMARPSQLGRRIRALLAAAGDRRPATRRWVMLTTLAVAALVVPLAMLRPPAYAADRNTSNAAPADVTGTAAPGATDDRVDDEDEANKTKPADNAPTLTWGKVISATVNDDAPTAGFLIDFDTGKVTGPPKELLEKENRGDIDKLLKWMAQTGIDAMGEINPTFTGLAGVDLIAWPVHRGAWDGKPDTLMRQVRFGRPGTPVPMEASGELPRTFAFKTREGGVGLLRFVEVDREARPQHMKVQIKLVQGLVQSARKLIPLKKVIKLEVEDDSPDAKYLLDLDTGRVSAAPPALKKLLKAGNDAAAFRWIADNGYDAIGETKSSVRGLMGFDMIAIPTISSNFDEPRLNTVKRQLALSRPGTPALITGRGELPATYRFKTREGGIGVLQITKVDRRRVTIRYKMLGRVEK